MRIQPHRTSRAAEWGPIQVLVDGTQDSPWDYQSTVQVNTTVAVDDQLLTDTGLESRAALAGILIIDCPATGWRAHMRCRISDGASSLTVIIPPGAVAKYLDISRVLILATPSDGAGGRARRVGDRLSETDTVRHQLEGSGERFPVEACDFAEVGLAVGALWALDFRPESWEDLYAAVVRLRVNVSHPMSDALLKAAHPDHELAMSVLRREIIMQELQQMATIEPAMDSNYEEGSVGAVLESMCQTYLRLPAANAVLRMRDDPADIGTRLQSTTGFLRRS